MELTITEQLELSLKALEPKPQSLTNPTTTPVTKTIVTKPIVNLDEDIVTFKTNMLRWANKTLVEGTNHLEIKEMKDLNSIVKDLEASQSKDAQGPTVNILIQNMLDRYDDDI